MTDALDRTARPTGAPALGPREPSWELTQP